MASVHDAPRASLPTGRVPSTPNQRDARGTRAAGPDPFGATGRFADRLKSAVAAATPGTQGGKAGAAAAQEQRGIGWELGSETTAASSGRRQGPLASSQVGPAGDDTSLPGRGRRDGDEIRGLGDGGNDHESPGMDPSELDPFARHLSHLTPFELQLGLGQLLPSSATPSAQAASLPPALASANLDEIVSRMVTRFALSGDKQRGTSHLAVGAGELSGGSITLEAEGRAVRVRIDAPPGVDARAFGEAVRTRLEARGLEPTIEIF
jgi:hypothetical protein